MLRPCGPAAPVSLAFLLLFLPVPLLPASPRATQAATAQAQPASPTGSDFRRGGLLSERPRAGSMEIPTTHYPARRASGLAQQYINYQLGGPHKFFGVQELHQATLEDIPNVGHKYHLKFSMEEVLQKQRNPVNCTAEILYHHGEPHVAPEVHYTVEGELGINTEQEDNKFYNRIKNLPEPLKAQYLPDSYGNVPAEMEPIRYLALVACGYVIWQNSTEETSYNVAQVKSVNQVKRNDDYLEFSYVVLIHNFVASQDIIPWHMQVLWHPQHGVKVIRNSRQPKHAEED